MASHAPGRLGINLVDLLIEIMGVIGALLDTDLAFDALIRVSFNDKIRL
jgi:hypothetical protein